jgi:Fic family protein
MVKIPEKAPDWRSIIKKNPQLLFNLPQSEIMKALIEKSDSSYYYWDKIRCQLLPKELDKKEVWAFIRFRRQMNMNFSPLADVKGNLFAFWLTDFIQKNLHLIDQNTSGNLTLSDPGGERHAAVKYIVGSSMEEAITSSQIEGAVATIKDAKEMLITERKPRDKSEQMIYNNYLTMQSIKNLDKRKLDLKLLLDLHVSITKDTLESHQQEGRFRSAKEDINIATPYGEILFTPPAAEEIEERLEALCRFANDQHDHSFIHPVIKAIILHFWMAYIHPFVDGNGRMARTLFYWYLLKHKYWLFEYISISKFILQKNTQYALAYLYSEHDENDLTYFIHFNIRVIMEAVEELRKHIQQQREKDDDVRTELVEFSELNLRQIRIVQHALDHPSEVFTIKKHQNLNRIAYQTARTDLLELVDKGWLKMIQKGKTFYFIPIEQLKQKYNSERNS